MNTLREAALKKIWSRPGMYLSPHERIIDATSFITNFLDGILFDDELSTPKTIIISAANRYFSIHAIGSYTNALAQGAITFERIFDVLTPETDTVIDDNFSLKVIRPIAWFAESCIVDFSTPEDVFQQIFQNGERVTPITQRPLSDQPPYISVLFALSPERFSPTTIDMSRMNRVISVWRKLRLADERINAARALTIQITRKRVLNYHYMLQITPSYKK
jgi:hypothetical protein